MDMKALNKTEREIYQEAEHLQARGTSAPVFSARFFGSDGLLRKLWKTDGERKAVVASELYKWLKTCLTEIRDREVAQFEKEVASLSGRLTVVVPRSLHAALKREAVQEGISLSELIRLKLGVAYRDVAGLLVTHDHPEPGKRKAI
jgi:predicted HicB family RNase H-like nuclease